MTAQHRHGSDVATSSTGFKAAAWHRDLMARNRLIALLRAEIRVSATAALRLHRVTPLSLIRQPGIGRRLSRCHPNEPNELFLGPCEIRPDRPCSGFRRRAG